MKMTTLCYIEKDGAYLMLHRTKKENDENRDKYVGIGGKFEAGESPEDCVLREIGEETGITHQELAYRGLITFVSDRYGTEYMHLFTAKTATLPSFVCDEGELVWMKKEDVYHLPMWEGDRIFLKLIETDAPFFSLKLVYQGETLISAYLNGNSVSVN